jgi:hypothetical protein
LGACYWQVTYFLSIRLIENSTLEAMRTQRDDFHPFRASQRDMKAPEMTRIRPSIGRH